MRLSLMMIKLLPLCPIRFAQPKIKAFLKILQHLGSVMRHKSHTLPFLSLSEKFISRKLISQSIITNAIHISNLKEAIGI